VATPVGRFWPDGHAVERDDLESDEPAGYVSTWRVAGDERCRGRLQWGCLGRWKSLYGVSNRSTPPPASLAGRHLGLRQYNDAATANGVPFGPRGGILSEVGALASDDIWAVGLASGYGDGGATTVPLAAYWDGFTWTDVEVPRVANRHHQLNDVVAISHNDVWAVGDYRNIAGAFHGVTYHWDGSSWSHVDSPIEHMAGDSGLDDVAATGPNDVWAIGGVLQGGVVLMHWDGSQWSLAQPPPDSGGSLAAVGRTTSGRPDGTGSGTGMEARGPRFRPRFPCDLRHPERRDGNRRGLQHLVRGFLDSGRRDNEFHPCGGTDGDRDTRRPELRRRRELRRHQPVRAGAERSGPVRAAIPGCDLKNADINSDGELNFGDINPFVALLTGG